MIELTEGQKAPDFKAKDQNGKSISLSDFSGKDVILYFYPKDDTPGCTAEACSFRDNYQSLIKRRL
jgi:peroxiredoxin Q/BCP